MHAFPENNDLADEHKISAAIRRRRHFPLMLLSYCYPFSDTLLAEQAQNLDLWGIQYYSIMSGTVADVNTGVDVPAFSVMDLGPGLIPPRTLSYSI